MFPLPCSTEIIVKQSNFSHFPASIISVISLFIRGHDEREQTAEKGAPEKKKSEREHKERLSERDGKRKRTTRGEEEN